MKINYIKLNNIGPYLGEHKFDLNTNSSRNIVLIGGKNGAGKTTFLKALKYGLFGSFSLGFKTDTDSYFNEIDTILNNQSSNDFYIEIEFEYIENFEIKKYILKRSWKKNNDSITEYVKISYKDVYLDDYETKELTDKLRAITSPQLINSYIFDGEKIGAIIENGEISSYLEEIFNSIFSIDMIEQTKKDLENYLSKKADESKAKSQIDSINYINKINTLKNDIKITENNLSTYISSKNNLLIMRKNNVDNFYKLGGLTKKQQEIHMKKINQFNLEKEKMSKIIRNFIENDLPLFMNFNLLEDALTQCNLERQNKFPKYLEEIEKIVNMDLSSIKSKLLENIFYCDTIHSLTDEEIEELSTRMLIIAKNGDEISPYLKNKYLKTDEYKLMKKNILDNENIETINHLLEENEKIDKSIIDLENTIKELEGQLQKAKTELEMYYLLYEKTTEELKKETLLDSSFIFGKTALDISDKFIKRITKYKLKQVSNAALEIFNDTIRKKNFITELNITKDFELELYNSLKIKIDPKTLSAGEMQILISSLIWSMFRIAGRREMFIFDTPLARLDNDNRQNFIEKIISTISSQVVILSTDSEFIGDNLRIIENNVYNKYLLNFDVATGRTSVVSDYFGGI